MPTYQGQISEDGLIDLVEYLKNLNTNYRCLLYTSPLTTGFARTGYELTTMEAREQKANYGKVAEVISPK